MGFIACYRCGQLDIYQISNIRLYISGLRYKSYIALCHIQNIFFSSCTGKVAVYQLFAVNTGVVYIDIWRPLTLGGTTDREYVLIGSNRVEITNTGEQVN